MTNFVQALEESALAPMDTMLYVCVTGPAHAYGKLREGDMVSLWTDYVRVCGILGRRPWSFEELRPHVGEIPEMCARVNRELPDRRYGHARRFLSEHPEALGKDVGSGMTAGEAGEVYEKWREGKEGAPGWKAVRRDLTRTACVRSGAANRGGRTVRLLVHDPRAHPDVWYPPYWSPEFEQMPVPEP